MDRETLPTQRAAIATYLLLRGDGYTVRELSQRLNITARGTRLILEKISLSLPVVDDGGVWRVLEDIDTGY